MSIRVQNLTKRFGTFDALRDINLTVEDGSLLALLGPSGSGKTTLLRIIAGLENADGGSIYHHDEDVTERDARERKVGFVFQHYALFRHMTIADNVAFGLKVRGVPPKDRKDRVQELLKLIRLDHLGERYPSQLSGGQRQRVALARALAAQPKVLLLDEPFGALDAKVRQELRQWLRRLHDQIHVTSIFVTHDQEEAFEVADRIVVMNQGRIEQVGSPSEVFEQPANAFVMDFLGNVNVFHGRVEQGKAVALQPIHGDNSAPMYVRPHELTLERNPLDEACIQAKILHVNPTGSRVKVELKAIDSEQLINAELTPERFQALGLKVNEIVYVSPSRVRVFMADYSI